jgi:hypothetical protein
MIEEVKVSLPSLGGVFEKVDPSLLSGKGESHIDG